MAALANSRFIDLRIDGVNVKYLSPDGSSITADIHKQIRKILKERKMISKTRGKKYTP